MRTALSRGKPDRVPVALVADFDFYCKAAGRPLWEFEYGDSISRATIQRDAHLRFPDNDFLLCWTGLSKTAIASRRVVVEAGRAHLEWAETGEREPIAPRNTAADWSERGYGLTSQTGWERPIEREEEIEQMLGEPPTTESVLESGIYEPIRLLRQDLGDGAYLAVALHGIFPATIDAMGGFERGMLALREKPKLFRTVIEHLAHRRTSNLEAAEKQGVDAAWLGGYLEGADLISPEVWREVALPGHRIQVEAARRLGLQVLFWFLGDAMPLLHDLAELGIDGLVLEQPRRGYCSDPAEVRRAVGKAFCVYGWNWELDFINDRRESISREVERQICSAGMDGAFIMGTTYLTSEAKLEAVDYFCREVARVSREVGY